VNRRLLGLDGASENRKAGLDRPLKFGRKHSAFRVTVLTPATTYPTATHFTDMKNSVNATRLYSGNSFFGLLSGYDKKCVYCRCHSRLADESHCVSLSSTFSVPNWPCLKSRCFGKHPQKIVVGVMQNVLAFYEYIVDDPHHRYLSWDHCYCYFQGLAPSSTKKDIDLASLHLAFYLAS